MSTLAIDPDAQSSAQRPAPPQPIPGYIGRRIERGQKQRDRQSAQRRLNYKFWRGEHYWDVNARGMLVDQGTVSWLLGGKKPSWRIRSKQPFVSLIVESKVSAATQRVPSYDVVPSKLDPEAYQAAALSEKVLLWGYDEWGVRRITTQAFTHAFVGGEGFVYPYWDASVGPFIEVTDPLTGETEQIGQGEIRTKVLSANEVYWEPGVDFEHARWFCIEQARTLEEVRDMPGFLGGDLHPDATDSEAPTDADKANLILVTEYFERPSAREPKGLHVIKANARRVVKDASYPCEDHKGQVLDEPLLVRISYTVEVDDRDRALVERIIDLQRTIDDCWNKLREWKNRCLNPQGKAPRGANVSRMDDQPGVIRYYTPVGGKDFEWEKPPQIPQELFQMLDKAVEHLRALSSDVDVQPDPRLTAQTAQSAIEQAGLRWQSFLGDGAEFHSRLARRYLYLVQRRYTEPRLLRIQGMWGPDLVPAFRGSDLLGEADVRVNPDSLTVQSRQQVRTDALTYAQNGWISPETAMMAISQGRSDLISSGWEFDVARANYIIQTIKQGPDALFALPDRPLFPGEQPPVDPNNNPLLVGADGQPKVPGYMPRPFDKVIVQKTVFETWMKTTDWDHLEPAMQHAALIYYQALLDLEAQQQMQAAQQQQALAQGQGMANAAAPQAPPMLPSQRVPDNQGPQGAPQ